MVNDYCYQGTRENFVNIYGLTNDADPAVRGRIAHPVSYIPANTLTPDDFFNRAQQCVNAYGGCSTVRSLHENWPSTSFGLTTMR